MPLRRHAGSEDKAKDKQFKDAECQTTVSLPSKVSAMWQCHCPEANTVVDRVAQEQRPAPRMLLKSFNEPSVDASEVDWDNKKSVDNYFAWGNKEAVDKMEREMRAIREREFLGEVLEDDESANDPRRDEATAQSPCTPGSVPRDPCFDFDDLDRAESEKSESDDGHVKMDGERLEAKNLCQTSVKQQVANIEDALCSDTVSGRLASPTDEPVEGETQWGSTCTKDRPIDVANAEDENLDAVKRKTPARSRVIGHRRFRMARGITVDSGAHDNVMPRRLIKGKFNQGTVRPSAASRAGVHYVACNNGRIPNEGEFDFKFHTEEKAPMEWCFQIAEVNKALAAVSALVDSKHRVIFDQDDDTGADCSFIIDKRTGHSTKMRRERNVWVVDAYVDEDPSMDFARPE